MAAETVWVVVESKRFLLFRRERLIAMASTKVAAIESMERMRPHAVGKLEVREMYKRAASAAILRMAG